MLGGYCRGCGGMLNASRSDDRLCPTCRAGHVGQALAHYPTQAEASLLAIFDPESARRLRRLRRLVRAGLRAD